MARLEAAFAETVASRDNERSKKASQRVRLLANPLIGVGEIQRTLEDYSSQFGHCHLADSSTWPMVVQSGAAIVRCVGLLSQHKIAA